MAVLLVLSLGSVLFACNENDTLESSDSSITSSESPLDSSWESDIEESSSSSPPPQSSTDKDSEEEKEPEAEKPVSNTVEYIRCTGDNVNIRSGAGTSYSVLGSAEKGTIYAVIEKKGSWYKTYYRNKIAYIHASYAAVVSLEKTNNADVENVLSEGYKLMGVPYVYGAVRLHDGKGKLLSGFTAQKFDCSSLVQYIFYHGADTLLNTTTRTQVVQGKYVARSNLKRGDCIYFTNEDRQYNTGIERIGHVAIYLGNNYILHTASDYARIEKLSTQRWAYYIEARRFV